MTRKDYPYVQRFRCKKTRKIRYYFRKPGFPRVTLPGTWDSPDFRAAYDQATNAAATPIGAARSPAGSISALCASYYLSEQFKALRPSTAAVYRRIIEGFRAEHGQKAVATMEPRHVRALIEAKAGPHARKRLLTIIAILMQRAVDLDWRADNPARDVRVRIPGNDGFATWTEAQIEAYRTHYPLGSRPRLLLELALGAGLRRGDLIRVGWRHVTGGELTIDQSKTGLRVVIPIIPELWAALEKLPRDRLTFLATATGAPFTAAGLGGNFRDLIDAAGLPATLSLHGLRKAAGRRLAEAGCTPHQIMAALGHRTIKEAERYCRTFSREKAAREGLTKVVSMFEREQKRDEKM